MTSDTPAPIQLEDLTYLPNGAPILDALNLTVRPAEIFAILGRSGAGKTTLLRLIMGLLRPTSGRVLINGADITLLPEPQLDQLRLNMGFVFQGAALFDSLTVADNVAFALVEHRRLPKPEIPQRVADLLALVEMSGAEPLLPAQLSGGMRKRVGIARALALVPSIILYDEPTAGLDPISAAAINDLIRRLRDHTAVTSLIVSHDVHSLRLTADRAALLHQGRFLAIGSIADLDAHPDPAVHQFLSGSPHGPLTDGQTP